jgi:hypothetical protein
MENRQGIQQDLPGRQLDTQMLAQLVDIGDQIGIGQHHTLGLTLRSRGVEHHCRLIRTQSVAVMIETRQLRLEHAHDLVQRCQRLAHIFQIEKADFAALGQAGNDLVELGNVDEFAGSDDGGDFSRMDGGTQIYEACGEIQRRGHPTIGR